MFVQTLHSTSLENINTHTHTHELSLPHRLLFEQFALSLMSGVPNSSTIKIVENQNVFHGDNIIHLQAASEYRFLLFI